MRSLLRYLPVLLFLAVLAGISIYLANSIAFTFGVEQTGLLKVGMAILTLFSLVGVMAFVNTTSKMGSFLFRFAATSMGFLLYLVLSFLVVDAVGLFVIISPLVFGVVAFSLATVVSIYGIINARTLKVTQVPISIKGLTKSVKAAHLTDTHLGHFRGAKNLQKIVDEINSQNVDVVFFTGDLLDSTIQLKAESMAPLKNLNAPVYFIEGNHDQYTGVDAIKDYLKSIGVNVLSNEITQWNELQVIGLNHMAADSNTNDIHASAARATVQSTLSKLPIDADKPTVLLHHGPSGIKYAQQAGVDLYLAGHTHAGQMWPATFFAKLMFEYNRGLHDYKGTKVYVCQGTGTFGPPMRVGTNSELAILQLEPKD
jgi:hypothetical protein